MKAKIKTGLLVLIALCFIMTLTSCGGRDLSTPSSRLVGHWKTEGLDFDDWYFGPVDPDTKIGNLVIVDDGEAMYANYRLISEDINGTLVVITMFSAADSSFSSKFKFYIDEGGQKMGFSEMMQFGPTYVDDKIEP